MSDLLQRMSEIVEDFVQQVSQAEAVVGIVVFGSFVNGKVRETSDLDLLVLGEDIEEYSRTRRREKGILLEIYRWPLEFFGKPFLDESTNVFQDAFCFAVMRKGRIVYDPKGILDQFKRHAQTHRLPYSHLRSLVERADSSLRLARSHLEKRRLEGAELEVRRAAEELGRALLLERDFLEIIPPKIYLPHLRKEVPGFYSIFCEVHNLRSIQRKDVEAAIQQVSTWQGRIVEEIRKTGKEDLLKQGEAIYGAQTELTNAQDCLENGDLEAAMLQARYSAIFVMSSVLRLLKGRSGKILIFCYMELLRSRHPYGEVLKSVMDFLPDRRRLREHIEILRNIIEGHDWKQESMQRVS
ncbi:MAG: nucleotidyltransferase domain-containing protein [Candidatus Bathyarchaeia archaeon]